MVSKPSDSSKSRKLHGEQKSGDLGLLTCKINQLKKQIQAERVVFIKEKVEKNKKRVESDVSQLLSLAMSRTDDSSMDNSSLGKMLSTRIKNPLHLITGTAQGSCDNDNTGSQDVAICVTAKLPAVEKIPPYTAWIFVNRNQRMAEDQSVVGKRRIYYEHHGGEAIICSDNEEEIAVPDEEKHQFSVGENHIIRMVCQDYEPSEEVLKILTQFIGGTTSQIHEAYNTLKKKDEEKLNQNDCVRVEVEPDMSILPGKSLIASLDSFDTLFCRRCLVFDCRLHGYSQTIITPTERQRYPLESQEEGKPCSDQCYLQLQAVTKYPERLGGIGNSEIGTSEECMYEDSIGADTADIIKDNGKEESKEITEVPVLNHASNQVEGSPTISQWKPLEKELYLKGLEIFGRNSCLIARNLLSGLKTCIEVYSYTHYIGSAMSRRSSTVCSTSDNNRKATDHKEQEMTSRLRLIRRKGRARKVKCFRSGHPLIWRRIADGKDQSYKQYTPCGCKSMCGKECPCVDNSTCCEKYCGCSKSCKNRFRGCHCAKSQCRSQQCPCFTAGRECDPDVCRNCWVSCGDGSLGEPPRRGEGECGNMRLLLMQQQRILLGKSDVAGWGAFLKNAVNKNDYLGEYTGELISHYEADMRGKLYDRANSSFLFNLNDQYVLDALRQGDKLKFANHSSKPNCYAKIIQVAGNHRVGIFAKERIEAGEELFYDYCYGPEQSPIWALKPDGSKGEGSSVPQGRAKKNQSHQ